MIASTDLALRVNQSYKWVLVVVFALMAVLETVAPMRKLRLSTGRRWMMHGLLYLATAIFFPLIFGAGSVVLAISVSGSHSGVLSRAGIPYAVRFFAWILVVDLWGYCHHRLCHSFFWLWRIHLLHHSDRDFDFTNQFRFHPLDSGLTYLSTLLAILLLTPPPAAVACYELLIILTGMLNHANLRLPAWLESVLRRVLSTPALHQIHHSIEQPEQHHNLGIVFIVWDRLFGTFLAVPAAGIDNMQFGVDEVGPAECIQPLHMITAPFRDWWKPPVSTKVPQQG